MIKGCKTIAEYAIRRWLIEHNFEINCFTLTVDGNRGLLEDSNKDTLFLVYNKDTRTVSVEAEEWQGT